MSAAYDALTFAQGVGWDDRFVVGTSGGMPQGLKPLPILGMEPDPEGSGYLEAEANFG